ncbi:hypothetical protein CLOLEP_01485 [[Clostridium] leptum DSM 753]|uniref:Uncharacterized protein n=1 Tax=[Clostridium] leptum DSM 753 TaxID=428125 RepID=A7VSE3_9FIRM|nr:hypothetical protein CLOLEP_01485 [[Clostridium] leptum DSM 753]
MSICNEKIRHFFIKKSSLFCLFFRPVFVFHRLCYNKSVTLRFCRRKNNFPRLRDKTKPYHKSDHGRSDS